MKIEKIQTFVVGNPPPRTGGRYFIFVKLTTDTGVTGIGEIYTATYSPQIVCKVAEDMFERYVFGTDPFHIEKMWRRTYGSGFSHRPDFSTAGVVSGLEMAMWDICGKDTGKPVYELLGGQVHDRLRCYTYLYPPHEFDAHSDHPLYSDPDLAAEAAVREVERGFTAVKLDPAGPYSVYDGRQPSLATIDRSVRMVAAIRKAVGNRADILFGTHGQFTASGAIRLAKQLEPYDPMWFEEPIPPDAPEEMAKVAAHTSIPIAAGERLTSKYEFAHLLRVGGASIIQLATGRCGGILEGKKIASIAETYHAQIAPHLYCGPIEGAANIQLSTCTPNFLILESIQDWGGFHAKILKKPIQFENGYVIPSKEPGLGVELNEEVALAHPYTGTDLHLNERQTPADLT